MYFQYLDLIIYQLVYSRTCFTKSCQTEILNWAHTADFFGVTDTDLPDGWQVEQVHILHRHGARYLTSQDLDGRNINRFALKIQTVRSDSNKFTVSLTFLSLPLTLGSNNTLAGNLNCLNSLLSSTATQYNYSAEQAVYKFIRMRVDNGILPLNTIRGGLCSMKILR